MRHVGENLDTLLGDYLKPIETNWQPSDFLPDSRQEDFPEQVRLFRESARELSYDYMAVLVGIS